MKYCSHCGAEIHNDAIICVNCGANVQSSKPAAAKRSKDDTMQTVVKVFLILGCVVEGWLIIPLAWCLPITISICRAMKEGRPVSTGLKVCSLLFVSLVGGICLLCMEDPAPEENPVPVNVNIYHNTSVSDDVSRQSADFEFNRQVPENAALPAPKGLSVEFIEGPYTGYKFQLADGHHTTFGRVEGKCNIALPMCGSVSSLHCALSYRNDSIYLLDQGSSNGTFVNGRKIAVNQIVQLESGSVISLGSRSCSFRVRIM